MKNTDILRQIIREEIQKLNETKFYAFWNGKKHDIEDKDLWHAKQQAITLLKVPKSKVGLLAVVSAKSQEQGDFQFEGKLNESDKLLKKGDKVKVTHPTLSKPIVGVVSLVLDKDPNGKVVYGVKSGSSDKGIWDAKYVSLAESKINEVEYKDALEKFNSELESNTQIQSMAKYYDKTPKEIVKHLQPRLTVLRYNDKSIKLVSLNFTDTNSKIKVHVSQTYKQNESVLKESTARSLSDIAAEIRRDWRPVNYAAKPYLDAMSQLDDMNDRYGMDSARSVVAYFLSNASQWKGDKAKLIKKELNQMLKSK